MTLTAEEIEGDRDPTLTQALEYERTWKIIRALALRLARVEPCPTCIDSNGCVQLDPEDERSWDLCPDCDGLGLAHKNNWKVALQKVIQSLGMPRCEHRDGQVQCCEPEGHDGPHLFKCASGDCPGYQWLASKNPHPVATCRQER